jgi:carbon monoxide dehydrogenase subunit G
MEMQGNRTLAVSQQQAWDALNDPEVLKACVPGCDKLERTADDQFSVGMTVKIGPVSAKFAGKIALSDIQAPQSYTIGFEGQGGAAGFGKGTSRVTLVPLDPGCELQYTVQASVGGKVAQLGQRLIDGAAKSMAEDFFKRFDAEMQKCHPEAYAAAAEAEAAEQFSPTVAVVGGAAGAASEAASKSGGIPAWAWVVGAVVVLGAIYLLR